MNNHDDDKLEEARDLIEDVRKPLLRAAKAGVVNPELVSKLGSASQKIVKADAKIETKVSDSYQADCGE